MSIKNFFRRLHIWFRRGGIIWLVPVLWGSHIWLAFALPSTFKPSFFNCGSVAFEITGGSIVLWQINGNVSKFKGTNIIKSFANYFKHCPFWCKQKSITLSVSGVTHSHTCDALSLSVNSQTLEQKVDFLMEEVERIDKRISDTSRKQDEKIKKLIVKDSELARGIRGVKADLEDAFTGDVMLEIFGALIFFQGVLMSAMV